MSAKRGHKLACIRGHAYTPENTLTARDGRRACRACSKKKALPNLEEGQGEGFNLMRLEARGVAWAAWVRGMREEG